MYLNVTCVLWFWEVSFPVWQLLNKLFFPQSMKDYWNHIPALTGQIPGQIHQIHLPLYILYNVFQNKFSMSKAPWMKGTANIFPGTPFLVG